MAKGIVVKVWNVTADSGKRSASSQIADSIAYIENPENKKEIDHIDGNPSNNNLDNLRWATPKENSNNNISLERMRKSHIGKESNIKGRKKVWIDKENKIYKMI